MGARSTCAGREVTMDPVETPAEQPAEAADDTIVGTLGVKLTLRGAEGTVRPTLGDLEASLKGWDLSEWGLTVSVTDIEWR